jgi:hypothetical protein
MKLAKIAGVAVLLAAAGLLMVPLASVWYESGGGLACTRCHEIAPAHGRWSQSSHRSVPCTKCHGDAWTLDVGFHLNNLHRVRTHMNGGAPERLRLQSADLPAMIERCRACHQQEFAGWQAGPHATTFRSIFLDARHNSTRLLMDDCLRCHGMHFEGGVREVVTPVATAGPWKLVNPELATRPVIPCMTCHSVHRQGEPLPRYERGSRTAVTQTELTRPSLGFFDRRSQMPVPLGMLPLPVVKDGERVIKASPDQRQALCYQCHAPWHTAQVGSGDDRTPMGVHEGVSCMACHEKHRQTARASCADCHPRLSNCGIDVEKMDTTFLKADSKHNIHWVKCANCHVKGVPARKARGSAS